MRVLIIEPHASGHHANYLCWLMRAAHQRHYNVVIATTRAVLCHPAVAALLSQFDDADIHVIDDPPSDDGTSWRWLRLVRKEYVYWKMLKTAAEDVRAKLSVDAVALPYVDYCFYALAVLGSPFRDLAWCGISMRLSVGENPERLTSLPWKWRFCSWLLAERHLKVLFSINPSVRDVPPNWIPATYSSKLRYLADPAESDFGGSRIEARLALGISDEDVAILVFGSLDDRKGIDALLSCISSRTNLARYVVILAGKQSETTISRVKTPLCEDLVLRKRLVILDRFLGDEEQGSVFAAADVVWVGYRKHIYMSGVLVLAGRAGLPVIGTAEGEIGRLIRRHDLGAAACISQPADVERALCRMLDEHTRREMGRRAQLTFLDHTVEKFGATVMEAFP